MGPLEEILAANPELKQTAHDLLNKPLAKSTMTHYGATIRKYEEFCNNNGYNYKVPTEKSVLHYITFLTTIKVSLSTLNQVPAALDLLMDLQPKQPSPFTPLVNRALEGARRKAAEFREPVKKAGEVKLETLQNMVARFIMAYKDNIAEANIYRQRTITRLVVTYFTFCRLSDFRQLQARHIEDKGDILEIVFPTHKNDQYHRGSRTVLVANGGPFCPVKIVRLYFQRLGLRFGTIQGDHTYLHCRIRKSGGRWFPDKSAASASLAQEELQATLRDIGMDPKGITDKSFKMLGVTKAMAAGIPVKDVSIHGRWLTEDMPLRYKHNSDDYKISVASKIPY
jgi:hypothetical protein